jgi:REP element-mobilizing transposase RayT
MPHSYNNLWIHAIWSTKLWHPFITTDLEDKLYSFIRAQFEAMNCKLSIINGMPDHVHCLFWLHPSKSIAEVIKQVKGSSSFYVNEHQFTQQKFAWQTGYSSFSVSKSVLKKTYYYIKHQKQHHITKSFKAEYDMFLNIYTKLPTKYH